MEQKPKHINEFKKGEIITKLENYTFIPQLDDISGKVKNKRIISTETSGIGTPYEYLGVVNGKILLKYVQDDKYGFHKKGEICDSFNYINYQFGWTKYVDPKNFLEKEKNKKEEFLNVNDLEKMLNNSIWN